MGRRLRLESHLEVDELERRYRAAKEPHERSRWQILWLLAKGQTAAAVTETTGYSRYWIGQLVRRYNAQGPRGDAQSAVHPLASARPSVVAGAVGGAGHSSTRAGT